MKKKLVKVTESQFKNIIKNKLNECRCNGEHKKDSMEEGLLDINEYMNGQETGAVELDKSEASNTSNIEKFTSKGIDVKLVEDGIPAPNEIDEELGEEQAVTLRHKFEGKNLNIYSTKEKVTLREVLKYASSLKDQPIIEDSFNKEKVNLYIKVPSSGRYKHLGSFSADALKRFREISDKEAITGIQSDALNESLEI